MTKKILISIGYKKREFEYQCLFAYFLEQVGFDVKLRYANFELYSTVFTWQPDIVVIGQVNQQENIDVARYAQRCGAYVVVLNTEGTYDDRGEVYRFGKETNDFVDILIAWGKKHKEDALKFSNIDSRKVIVAGTPKLDMYRPQLASLLLVKKPYQDRLDPKKKTICVSTAFPSTEMSWEKIKDNLVYQKLGRKMVELRTRGQQKSRDTYIELALLLAKQDRYNVIFRIHPLEQPQYYRECLQHEKRIIFDNEIIPAKLFTVTDLLVHRTSTLGTEAWITNVPTICLDPLYDEDREMMPFTNYEKIFHTIPEIVIFLDKHKNLNFPDKYKKEKEEYLKYWFNYVKSDKQLSSKKIALILKQLPDRKKHRVWHNNVGISFGLAMLALLLYKKYPYEIIALRKGEKYRQIVEENYILDEEVKEQIKQYHRLIRMKV